MVDLMFWYVLLLCLMWILWLFEEIGCVYDLV